MKMHVVIPSRGRADYKKQLTMQALIDAGVRPTLVVPKNEVVRYYNELDGYAVDIAGCPADGIAATRAWILDKWRKHKVLMLDDDMRFYRRPRMSESRLVKLDWDSMGLMIERISELLEQYPMVGISARQGNNFQDKWLVENTRAMNAYGFNPPVLRRNGIKFGRIPLMEDFDIILQILRSGMSNAVLYRYCWNQTRSGDTGGCSSYRTAKLQAKAAHTLKSLHPDFVTIVKKKSLSAWDGMKERVDVRVAWAKAAKDGRGTFP